MTTPSEEGADRDLAHIEATTAVKLSAALHGIAGTFTALAGLQFVTSFSFLGPDAYLNALPYSLLVLGAAQVGLALMVLRNHHPAAIAGACLAPLAWVASFAWLGVSVSSAMFSLMALAAVPTTAAAALLAPFTLSHTKRGWAAKKRLQESGIELGL